MVAKFRKKPVIVEAVLFTGDNVDEIVSWSEGEVYCHVVPEGYDPLLQVKTPGGPMRTNVGDWIVKEEHRFYPCKPYIFEMAYEPVEEEG